MHLLRRMTGLALCAVLLLPFAAGAQNAIEAIAVEEGPNNTVISIKGSKAPTFTVFKLLDPVRLLVDVAGSHMAPQTNANVQIRNGVLHDVETVQFESRGRTVTRVVIGFDLEATYTVKTDGKTIRVVVDGADRRLPSMNEQQAKEALLRAKQAIAAEKALREKLKEARLREEKLLNSQQSAVAEQERMAAELQRLRADAARLQSQLSAANSTRVRDASLAKEAAINAERRAAAAAAAERAAQQRIETVKAERAVLQKERDALKQVVAAAAARKKALSKALAAESARRKAAQRAREEEEALLRVARRIRKSEEERANALKSSTGESQNKDAAIQQLRTAADALKSQSEEAKAEIESLRAQLVSAKKKDHTGRVKALEAALKRTEKDTASKLAQLKGDVAEAQEAAARATTAYETAKQKHQAKERLLKSQLAERDQTLKRQARAQEALKSKIAKRNRAITVLRKKDEARYTTEKALEELQSQRVATQQKLLDLKREQKRLKSQISNLSNERDELKKAAKIGETVEKVDAVLRKKRERIATMSASLEDARQTTRSVNATLRAQRRKVASVKAELANEKADLAAVLNQKTLFAKEVAELQLRRQLLTKDISAAESNLASTRTALTTLKKTLGQTKNSLSAIQEKRDQEMVRIAALKEEVKNLEQQRELSGDKAALERILVQRQTEVKTLKAQIAQARKANRSKDRKVSALDRQLTAALEKARAEAKKSEAGRKRLKQLEKFVAAQKGQLDTFEKNDKTAALDVAQQEITSLKAELKRMRQAKATSARENRLATNELRKELRSARYENKTVEGKRTRVAKTLAARQERLEGLQTALIEEKKARRAADRDLAVTSRKLERLVKRQARTQADVTRLEKALMKAEVTGDAAASLRTELARSRSARDAAEQKLEKERSRRKADQVTANRKVKQLTSERNALERQLNANLRALKVSDRATGKELNRVAKLETQLAKAQKKIARLDRELASAAVQARVATRLSTALDALAKTKAALKEERKAALMAERRALKAEHELKITSRKLSAAKSEVASLESDLDDAEKAGSKTSRIRKQLRAARDRVASLDDALKAQRARSLQLADQLRAEREVSRAQRGEIQREERRAKAAEKDLANTQKQLAAAKREVKELETTVNGIKSTGTRLDRVRLRLSAARSRVQSLTVALKTQRARSIQLAETLRSEREKSRARLVSARDEGRRADAAERELAAVRKDLGSAQKDVADLETKLKGLKATDKKFHAVKDSLSAARSRVEALKANLKTQRARSVQLAEQLRSEREKSRARLVSARDEGRRADAAERELAAVRKDLGSAQKDVAHLETKLKGLKATDKKFHAVKDSLAAARGRVQTLSAALAKQRNRSVDLADQLRAQRKATGEIQRAMRSIKRARAAADKRVLRLEEALAAAQAEGKGAKHLAGVLKAARLEAESLGSEVDTLRSANEVLQEEKTGLAKKAKSLDSALGAMTRARDVAHAKMERLKSSLADARARGKQVPGLKREVRQAEALAAELDRTRTALSNAKSEKKALRRDLVAERTNRRKLENSLALVTGARDRARSRVASLENALAAAKKTGGGTRKLKRSLKTAQKEKSRLNSEVAGLKAQLAEANGQIKTAKGAAKEARQQLDMATKRVTALEKNNATTAARVARLEAQLANVNESSDGKKQVAETVSPDVDTKDTVAVAKVPPTVRVKDVTFSEQENVSKIRIELDGTTDFEVVEQTNERIVLHIKRARIPRALERRLDTSDFYGPIRMVSTFADPDDPSVVRVVVELNDSVRNQLAHSEKFLEWSFFNDQQLETKGRMVAKRNASGDAVRYEPTAVGGDRVYAPPAGGGSTGAGSSGGGVVVPGGGVDFGVLNPFPRKKKSRRRYKGQKINLTIKDADIQQVLTFLAREGGVNIVASDGVQGLVTVHLKEVPWDLALDVILKSRGLDYVVEDGVYRVAPVDVIAEEFEKEVNKRKQLNELKQLQVQLVAVNYANAEVLAERVKGILSEKGSVSTDPRTNTLIIKDIEEHVIAAEDLVRRLDTQTPQVLIEARIVEASSNFSEDIGIQWGGNYTASPAFGNDTGLVFPAILGIAGAADDATAPTGGLLNNTPKFAVNLPAAIGAGAGGGLGLTLGTLSGSGSLAVRLGAAEERGSVKIISSPRVATLDNNEALISQGISIPISVVSSLGVNTQFFNANLSLRVTPQVTQDGNVNLNVNISKNEPNFGQTGANGNPTIERKEAQTNLLVRDGDTAVIGGIYTRNTSQSYKKIPGLGDIPFLGWLFKSRTQSDSRTEMILFITPRIINRSASRVRVD